MKPIISVLTPVHNGEDFIEKSLNALFSSDFEAFEVIVVDDGSTDRTGEILRDYPHPIRVLRNPVKTCPGRARNMGAEVARGDILLFIDSDVVIRRDNLSRVWKYMKDNPQVTALFGSYDSSPPFRDFTSTYKNLFHHFIHQNSTPHARSFWSGCGAVRREEFFRAGRFSETHKIEDIEFGYRLSMRGGEIHLMKDLQVTHLKPWTFWRLVKTDLFVRAIPWTILMLEKGVFPNDLNFRHSHKVSAALIFLSLLLVTLIPFQGPLLLIPLPLLIGIFLALNSKLYLFFYRKKGVIFTIKSISFHAFYYLYSSIGFLIGLIVSRHPALKRHFYYRKRLC